MATSRRVFAVGAAGTMGLRIAYVGLGLLSAIVLTRMLTPAEYGLYAFAYALAAVFAIPSQLGIPTLATRQAARAVVSKNWSELRGFINWAHFTIGAVSLIVLLGAFSVLASGTIKVESAKASTILVALLLVPIASLSALRAGLLRGLKKVLLGQLPEQLIRPGAFLLLIIFLHGRADVTPAVAMTLQVIATALALLLGWGLFLRYKPKELRSAAAIYEGRAWLISAVPLGLSGAMQLISSQFDILFIGFFRTTEEVGLYRIAVQLSIFVAFGLQITNGVVAPYFASYHAAGNLARLQSLVTKSGWFVLLISLPVALAFIVFGEQIISLCFGLEYKSAYPILVILSIGQFVNVTSGSVGLLLNMCGRERETAKALMVATVANVSINLALIPIFGVIGAAVANCVTIILWNVLMWKKVRNHLGIESIPFLASSFSSPHGPRQ